MYRGDEDSPNHQNTPSLPRSQGVASLKLSHPDPTSAFGPALGFAYQDGNTEEKHLGFVGMYTESQMAT